MSNWISVKERLPNKRGRFLVCLQAQFGDSTFEKGEKRIHVDMFWELSTGKFDFMFNDTKEKQMLVTHWQELPELPLD